MTQTFFKAACRLVCCAAFLYSGGAAFAQDGAKLNHADPALFIGTTLTDLINAWGAPKHVYPVRGSAAWQDDVVFIYDYADFFISENRVWQLKLHSAYGVKVGDTRAHVRLALNHPEEAFDGHSLYRLPVKVWPVTLRINWDASHKVSGIFVYRSDF